VPLHFSRFFPTYQLTNINPTPRSSLARAWEVAKDKGLKHVYQGNISGTGKEHTYCSSCKRMIIQRSGFAVDEVLVKNGQCLHCGKPVEGVWA
jgi:pyruvate formate lyase activating enzyme